MKRWITTGVALLGLTFGETKAADPPKVIPEAEQGEGVSLTVYNQNFVIVKERRKLELVKGRGVIKFKDVASTILPDTVQFGTLRDPGIARVVEQNYEFDLVGANKLLEKYIDRDIAIVTQDGETIKGKLLSFDDSQLMLKTDKGIDLLPRVGNVKDVQFSALPGGLLTRPTLVWKLDSKNTGAELVKVAYRANEMSWRVDYRARLNQAGDRLSLAGWVTVTNNTGTSYRNAQVKLMAGDVNTINTNPIVPTSGPPPNPNSGGSGGGPAFVEKTFSDYHLYEMQRKTDLLDRETKQIELMDIDGVTFDKKYVTGTQYRNKVAVVVEFENDEKKTP